MNKTIRAFAPCVLLAIFTFCTFCPTICHGHDEIVHRKMSGSAFESSEGLTAFLTENLGSENAPFTEKPALSAQPIPFAQVQNQSPRHWLVEGSYWEDMTLYNGRTLRCLDHFYTLMPQRTAGQVMGLTDASEPWYGLGYLPGGIINSFDWASQRGIAGPYVILGLVASVGPNTETWQNARDYEYATLTYPTKAVRDENMAHMLYAVGHVLHLNQDTSQPDHVRNDNHFNEKHRFIETFGAKTYYFETNAFPQKPRGWIYWHNAGFKSLQDFWDRGLYKGNSSALKNDAGGGAKLGLAEFSNGNFLGEDALYREYFNLGDVHYFPFPALETSTDFRNRIPGTTLGGRYIDTEYLKDGVQGNRVYLRKTRDGIPVQHHSVLTYMGVKTPLSAGFYPSSPVRKVSSTINSTKVLDDYHAKLIPKAIEYSAGILDYFFRGKLEITSTWNGNGTCTLHVKNKSKQDLKGGAFQLFWDDNAGVRAPLSITTASPVAVADDGITDVTFTPIGAGASYMLVYQGTIGSTSGAAIDPVDGGIAIAAKRFKIINPVLESEGITKVHSKSGFAEACNTSTPYPKYYLNKIETNFLSHTYDHKSVSTSATTCDNDNQEWHVLGTYGEGKLVEVTRPATIPTPPLGDCSTLKVNLKETWKGKVEYSSTDPFFPHPFCSVNQNQDGTWPTDDTSVECWDKAWQYTRFTPTLPFACILPTKWVAEFHYRVDDLVPPYYETSDCPPYGNTKHVLQHDQKNDAYSATILLPESEYTDTMLLSDISTIVTQMPYPNPSQWFPGSGLAKLKWECATHEKASAGKFHFRFKVQGSEAGVKYRIGWVKVTSVNDGPPSDGPIQYTQVVGTGDPINPAVNDPPEEIDVPAEGESISVRFVTQAIP